MRRIVLWVSICVLMSLSTAGCIERKGAAIGPNIGFGQAVSIDGGDVSAVDVMFVIDNSGSMAQEQSNLAVQIPALVRNLAEPPDADGDGNRDWNPVEQLRIGIVTTDVGIGDVALTSLCMRDGDDGELRDGVFEWSADGSETPDAFADRVRATVVGLGIEGCAFEQPLEAAARAVARAPSTGFPSAEGLFALIVVTDEEDCSVDNDDVFFGSIPLGLGNVVCTRNQAQLTSTDELLRRIRGDRPEDDFIFAAITGLPVDLPPDASTDAILAHPRMAFTEVMEGGNLTNAPACEFIDSSSGESLGRATPARRLVELGAAVPDSVLTTICTDDFGPAIGVIAARIGGRVPGVCLVRALPAAGGAEVPCAIAVTLPESSLCGSIPGYTLAYENDAGREVCSIAQIDPAGGLDGFYYDPDHETCAQLVITEAAQPPIGASVNAECFFPLLRIDGDMCARHSQCESGWCDPVVDACAPYPTTLPGDPPVTGG